MQDMFQQGLGRREEGSDRAFGNADDAVFLLDARTRRIRACNLAARRMFGYEPDELIGYTPGMLHLDSNHSGYFDTEGEQQLHRDGIFRGRFNMLHRDGTTFVATHTMTLLGEAEGADAAISIIHDDSAESPLPAPEETATVESRFQALFMDCPLPLWLCERGTLRLLETNGAALRLFACPDEAQLLASSLADFLPDATCLEELNAELEAATFRFPTPVSRLMRDTDGADFRVALYPYPVHLEPTGALAITGVRLPAHEDSSS